MRVLFPVQDGDNPVHKKFLELRAGNHRAQTDPEANGVVGNTADAMGEGDDTAVVRERVMRCLTLHFVLYRARHNKWQ